MLLIWKVRYFDRTIKDFADRYLDTGAVEPARRAALELIAETGRSRSEREIVRFRAEFTEIGEEDLHDRMSHAGGSFVGPTEYFEDEIGNEITLDEIVQLRTGNPNARVIPRGAERHDIEYMLADPQPLSFDDTTLSDDDLRVLGYFARDFRELATSAFYENGPGALTVQGGPVTAGGDPVLETSVTDDEIRSFVTIFRRLYMDNEPANLPKAVAVFVAALGDHPLSNWVAGAGRTFEAKLAEPPTPFPMDSAKPLDFDRKRLVDVFLYTRYAHQPDARRQRQFTECLDAVEGKRDLLTWFFLVSLQTLSLSIVNVGKVITGWYERYCEHHGRTADVVGSLQSECPGIGTKEKEGDRQRRLLREKCEDLATDLWRSSGRPPGGPMQFLDEATKRLTEIIG